MHQPTIEQQPLEVGQRRRHHLCCLGELLEALGDHAFGEPGAQQRRLEEVPIPWVIGHPLNIVLTEQVAQRISDVIVINRAARRDLQTRWFRDQCDAEHEESLAFADAATCGMGWTETRLDYDIDPNGAPKIERVDPREMFWDRAAKQANLIDARRIYRMQSEIPLLDAKRKWPKGIDGLPIVDDSDYDAGWATVGDDQERPYVVHRGGEPRIHDMDDNTGTAPRYVTIVQVQWYEEEDFYRGVMVNP